MADKDLGISTSFPRLFFLLLLPRYTADFQHPGPFPLLAQTLFQQPLCTFISEETLTSAAVAAVHKAEFIAEQDFNPDVFDLQDDTLVPAVSLSILVVWYRRVTSHQFHSLFFSYLFIIKNRSNSGAMGHVLSVCKNGVHFNSFISGTDLA